MKKLESTRKRKTRIGLVFILFLIMGIFPGNKVQANELEGMTLRVGYAPEGIFMMGEEGEPRTGYGYEYLQRIAGYGGWTYEYISATFPEQLKMLETGELDIAVNISFTEERKEVMDFSELPMGEENYYICVQPESTITADDLSSLEGKIIAVTRDSYQLQLLRKWLKEKKINCTIVESDGNSPNEGVDAYVTMDTYYIGNWNPVFKIGESKYYFGLNKEKEGLKEAFDNAQRSVLEITPYYAEQLHTKYFGKTLVNGELNQKEQQWIKENPIIYLGYYDDFLPYSDYHSKDKEQGYLSFILNQLKEQIMEYGGMVEAIPYTSMEQLKKDFDEKKLHLIFPMYLDLRMAEKQQILLSDEAVSLPLSVIYREVYSQRLYEKIALTKEDPLQESFILTSYPLAEYVYYDSLEECIDAVLQGQANCTIVNTMMAEKIMGEKNSRKELKYYHLTGQRGVGFGIRKEDSSLLSIINRSLQQIPHTTMEKAVIDYAEQSGQGRSEKRAKEILITWVIILIMVLFTLGLYSQVIRKKAKRQQQANNEIIDVLGTVVEYRSLESGQHIKRVKGFTEILGNYMMKEYPEYGLTRKKLDIIVSASALHDIGKVAVPDHILLKPGKLTAEEFELMKQHTSKGSDILKHIHKVMEPEYAKVSHEICRYHHERYDGKGYPDRLKEDEIPIAAQLVSIADVYDALTNERCYKIAFSCEEAFQMILEGQCGSFSPKLLDALRNTKEEFIKCSKTYGKGDRSFL